MPANTVYQTTGNGSSRRPHPMHSSTIIPTIAAIRPISQRRAGPGPSRRSAAAPAISVST